MSSPGTPFDADALLAHVGWVRALARSLVPSDPQLAEDIAQDACLVAIEHRPDTRRPLTAWLARVVENLVRRRHRDAAKRVERERGAAALETQPPAPTLDETLSVHRALVEAVMALEQPYRETILLRFFEELSPSAIARRQGLPVATVKTRLARGLARLRERLDRSQGGDGRSWLVALIPLTKNTGGTTAQALGALLVSTKTTLVAVVVLIACGAIAVLASRDARTPAAASSSPEAQPSRSEAQSSSAASVAERVAPPSGANATAAPAIAPGSAALAPPTEPRVTLRGRVIDVDSWPRAGLQVCFAVGRRDISAREFDLPRPTPSADSPPATTDGDGEFELLAPSRDGELFVSDASWTTVLASMCSSSSSGRQHVIVVAPRLQHSGRVVDEAGAAVAGARVEIQVPRALRLGLPGILDNSAERSWVTQSGADGRFAFDEAPRVEGAQLGVLASGFLTLAEPAPTVSQRDLELVLRRPDLQTGTIAGQVIDELGRPVADARVSLGHQALCATDERGEFRLAPPAHGARDPWIAAKPGHLPAISEASPAVQSGRLDSNEFVVLRLGPPPLSIAGRVVDAEDRPLAGLRVFVADPTFLGANDEVPLHVEGLLAGAAQRAELERLMADAPSGSGPEDILRNTSSVLWTFVESDAEGRFVLEGLLDRDYRLSALDPRSALRVDTGPIAAGTRDATIRVPAEAFSSEVRGQVVSSDGRPVPGVRVTPSIDVLSVRFDEHSSSTVDFGGRGTLTDDQGRFTFERLPRGNLYLTLRSDDILPLDWARGSAGGVEAKARGELDRIVIQVELRYHFQVEGAPELADEVSVLDERDQPLQLTLFEGTARTVSDVLPLAGGRSSVLVVGAAARTLVLRKDGAEVRRLPLALERGRVNLVRY